MQLPQYQSIMAGTHGPQSLTSIGNAMELVAGLSYTANAQGSNLPEGHVVVFPSEKAVESWKAIWHAFVELGLTVTPSSKVAPSPPATAASTQPGSASSPSQPASGADDSADFPDIIPRDLAAKAHGAPMVVKQVAKALGTMAKVNTGTIVPSDLFAQPAHTCILTVKTLLDQQ